LLSKSQAKELEKGIVADITAAEGSVVAAAEKIEAFIRGKGWKVLGFTGMNEWRDERMNFSLFYNARNAAKLLAAGVPAATVERMKLTNINTLTRKLPESKWNDEKVLELAAGPVKEFDAKVSKQSNEIGMNVEDLVSRGFRVSVSLAESWDKAIRIARLVDGCKDIESCVEALVPRAEIEGEMGESFMGVHARLLSQAMRKLNGEASRSGTALLFINQTRSKIGVVYGNPNTNTGGKALEFYSSIRVEIRRKEFIKEGEKIVGIHSQLTTKKNQVAPPFEDIGFDIYSGKCSCHGPGIDKAGDLLDSAVASGVIEKNGSWFELSGEKLGQGRVSAAANLFANPKIAEVVRGKVLAAQKKER